MDEWFDRLDQSPMGFAAGRARRCEPRFGFTIEVPRRFIPWEGTMDPIALSMREPMRGWDEELPWPLGYRDPKVIARDDIGFPRILRTIEIDALLRDQPLTEDEFCSMWLEARSIIPNALESRVLRGFRMIDARQTTLGPLPALAFEWRRDIARADRWGGDHAVLVWALHPQRVYHVYHHCCDDRWDEQVPEFRRILDSFELLDIPAEGERS